MNRERVHTIVRGTELFHGTSSPERFEKDGTFEGPGWVSDDIRVAREFVRGEGPAARVITFRAARDIELIEWRTGYEIEAFLAPTHGEDAFYDMDMAEIAEAVCDAGYEGWIIPNNYPEGADILLCDPASVLELERIEPGRG